jgi:predicted Rossmann fold nucleotide-binding protein DprA/Smf involved in DNA uptake
MKMIILDQIEKLINEHGSSTILRDHLALFKDQVVLLEKENNNLKSKITILKTKNAELTKENQELREKVQEYEQPHKNLVDEKKIDILKLLFNQDKLPTEKIAQILGYEIQTTKFHLEELKANNMVACAPSHRRNEPPSWKWSLTQEGRRCLIENKLIS